MDRKKQNTPDVENIETSSQSEQLRPEQLRRGWTTGACACAAAKAAFYGILNGTVPSLIDIRLPSAKDVTFRVESGVINDVAKSATASVIKDAGDDPDVTHGVEVIVEINLNEKKQPSILQEPHCAIELIDFVAGDGVGTVTKDGLPIAVGEAAITPSPRKYITDNLRLLAEQHSQELPSLTLKISIPNGQAIAQKTWNSRLGIIGGLSILGTSGVVIPYSCSAWIHSIHRGIDVMRAAQTKIAGAATGRTSEQYLNEHYHIPLEHVIDMGDFFGAMAKYLRKHPLPALMICGGAAKILKLAQGNLDLHSKRSQINFEHLHRDLEAAGANPALCEKSLHATSLGELLKTPDPFPAKEIIAQAAAIEAKKHLPESCFLAVLVVDRQGQLLTQYIDAGFPEPGSLHLSALNIK